MDERVIFAPGGANPRFVNHISFPKNIGRLPAPTGEAVGVGVCGDSVTVGLLVEGETITDIRCEPHGCVYTLACASAMSELAKGLSLDQALELTPTAVEAMLGGLPEDHLHCARLAVNSLGEAIGDVYRRRAAGR